MISEGNGGDAAGYGKRRVGRPFKKGQSGNPRGRPPRPKGLAAELFAALDEPQEVEGADGKRRKIARRRLGIARLAEKFAAGDPRATGIVLDLLLALERRAAPEPAAPPPLAATDRRVIANLIARLRGA
jgi:Family of unknown function (DUF5681)